MGYGIPTLNGYLLDNKNVNTYRGNTYRGQTVYKSQ